MSSIILALIIQLIAACAVGVLLYLFRRRITYAFSTVGFGFIILQCGLLLGSGIAWCISLLPPINDPYNPIVRGVGGDPYGLDYDVYPDVAILFSLLAGATAIIGVFVSRMLAKRPELGAPLNEIVKRLPLEKISAALAVGSFLVFLGLFSWLGWDRFWKSPVQKYEGGFYIAGFIDARLMTLLWFLIGIICSVSLLKRSLTWKSLFGLSWVVVALLIFSSRMLTVLIGVALACLWLRANRKLKIVLIIPFAVVLILALRVPLEIRREPGTGLYYVGRGVLNIFNEGSPRFTESAVELLQNFGQGFPVFVEAYKRADTFTNIMHSNPEMYTWLAFSPFPSIVDGYATNYHEYRNKINFFTPFSTYSELYSITPSLFFLVPLAVLIGFCLLLRIVWGLGRPWFIAMAVVVFGCVGWQIFAQQYLLRQSSRFAFYSAEIVISYICVMKLSGYGTRRRPRGAVSASIRYR